MHSSTSSELPPKPRARILFVDDEKNVLDAVSRTVRTLRPEWSITPAQSVDAALELIAAETFDAIITDVHMPWRDGFELLRELSNRELPCDTPVVVLTGVNDSQAKRRALDAGALDLLSKPVCPLDLIARVSNAIRIKKSRDILTGMNADLEQRVLERTVQLEQAQLEGLVCLAIAGECRDSETGQHLVRVAHYSRCLAKHVLTDEDEVSQLFRASPLHDIGKLGIDDAVLRKKGTLDESERAHMQQHCELGYRILTAPAAMSQAFHSSDSPRVAKRSNPILDRAATIALSHHERWDGSGYPRRLSREAIPVHARIVSIADVYDALTTRRPYKSVISHDASVVEIQNASGTFFDPDLVAAFLKVADEFNDIRERWLDVSPAAITQQSEIARILCSTARAVAA